MGSRRLGLARVEKLIENLKRELTMGGTKMTGVLTGVSSTVTTDTTLTTADSGKVIRFDIASSDVTITLPTTVTAGLTYTFLCVGASAKTLFVDAGSASIVGAAVTFAVGSSTSRAAYNEVKLGFADNHLVGDRATIIGDGTNWRILEAMCGPGFTAS